MRKFPASVLVVLSTCLAAAPGAAAQVPATTCFNVAKFDPENPSIALEAATVVGTSRKDVIRGSEGRDVIVGLGGNDVIFGRGGDDVICGGEGSDHIAGAGGADSIVGDTGESFLLGLGGGRQVPGGDDDLFGGDGDDSIGGEGGRDVVHAGQGNDFATGQMDDDKVFGEAGDDELFGGPGDDKVKGGGGTDLLVGNFGSDILRGGKGDDFFNGDAFFGPSGGFDVCHGQQGTDLSFPGTCEEEKQIEGTFGSAPAAGMAPAGLTEPGQHQRGIAARPGGETAWPQDQPKARGRGSACPHERGSSSRGGSRAPRPCPSRRW